MTSSEITIWQGLTRGVQLTGHDQTWRWDWIRSTESAISYWPIAECADVEVVDRRAGSVAHVYRWVREGLQRGLSGAESLTPSEIDEWKEVILAPARIAVLQSLAGGGIRVEMDDVDQWVLWGSSRKVNEVHITGGFDPAVGEWRPLGEGIVVARRQVRAPMVGVVWVR